MANTKKVETTEKEVKAKKAPAKKTAAKKETVKKETAKKAETKKATKKVETEKVETAEKVLVKATAKTIRHPARKVRYVLDLVRGKDVNVALGILKFTPNHAAEDVTKVLKSAIANAKNNNKLDESKLYIKECYANEGFTLKRYMPRAKGSAGSIMKRTSHITIVVTER